MAILVDEHTRVMIQGITGNLGRVFAKKMITDGTQLVAGVTPGKGGQEVFGIPVYSSVEEALSEKEVNCSFLLVPAPFVKDAILEAVDAGIKLSVVYTEGMPIHHAIHCVQYARLRGAYILGPNSAGIISPRKCNVSDLNCEFVPYGNIGIVSKSGTLTYEVIEGISKAGIGISTVCCLGGDPVIGVRYVDVLKLFEEDSETVAIVLLGEIGGTDELEAAKIIKSMQKPVFAYVAGQTVPPGKKMGHAGAIIYGEKDKASYKSAVLRNAGALTAKTTRGLAKQIRNKMCGGGGP